MVNHTEEFKIVLVVAVGTTCILSIIGSLAIIITFIIFRDLRNTTRYLLFNLSIADLIVAVTNLIGALYSLKFLKTESSQKDPVCIAQASIGLVGVDASVLWTCVFIVYTYVVLACYRLRPRTNFIVLSIVTLILWLVPIALVIVFLALKYFGYEEDYSPAFCTIYTKNKTEIYRALIGYELFLYSSFVILPVFTTLFSIHLCYIVS